MDLKQRKEGKLLMTKIINAAQAIKRDMHEFNTNAETFAQMSCLEIFVAKGRVLMDTLKPQQPDDTMQGVLLDVNGTEPVRGKVVIIQGEEEDED